tara:strand:- start:56 stop:559 length:504 start_codon:yes stop_codon:yes gene_type:complete
MTNSVKNIDMIGSVKLFFINYLNFSGRASRGEFWWAYLAYIIASFACSILDIFIGGIFYALFDNEFLLNIGFFINILIVATSLGWISLTSRRLQDTGYSGWWQMLYLTIIPTIIFWVIFVMYENPIILSIAALFTLVTLASFILILVWLILPASEDENQWGRNPLLD